MVWCKVSKLNCPANHRCNSKLEKIFLKSVSSQSIFFEYRVPLIKYVYQLPYSNLFQTFVSLLYKRMPKDLPIHKFCGKGDLSGVEDEIENGTDINIHGAQQRTCLHKAVGGGHADIVDLLLKNGAKTDSLDKGGKTALHWAALTGSIECIKILMDPGKSDINAKTKLGATACHLAAEDDKCEMLTWLIENGADADSLNNKGLTPYDKAKAKGHKNCMKILRPNSGSGCACAVQ